MMRNIVESYTYGSYIVGCYRVSLRKPLNCWKYKFLRVGSIMYNYGMHKSLLVEGMLVGK